MIIVHHSRSSAGGLPDKEWAPLLRSRRETMVSTYGGAWTLQINAIIVGGIRTPSQTIVQSLIEIVYDDTFPLPCGINFLV